MTDDFIDKIIQGDALTVLKTMPDEFVDCCITSPPYWGLRNYNVEGQLGLEKTPEEYVAKMVEVFREVKRVLKKTGVLFLNLGDSYWNSGGAHAPEHANPGLSKSALRGGVQRAGVYGASDKVPEDYPKRDYLCENLCGECRRAYLIGKSRNDNSLVSKQSVLSSLPSHEHKVSGNDHSPTSDFSRQEVHSEVASQDLRRSLTHEAEPFSSLQESKHDLSYRRPLGELKQKDNSLACLLCGQTSTPCVWECGYKTACTFGTVQTDHPLNHDKLDISSLRKAYPDYTITHPNVNINLKPKDLIGIPWRLAFALQSDGWWLRQDIIWCLSGGTWIYARTQKGVMPAMIRDLARLKPDTIQLWDGKKWTKVKGFSKSKRKGDEIEFVLRSGERISCTPTHKFPTNRGLLEAKDIKKGDILEIVRFPDVDNPKDCVIDEEVAWFAGLYIAEGSRSDDCIQIAGHSKEVDRWAALYKIAKKYGGYITRTIDGNNMDIRLYGKVLNALIDELVSGKTAKDKGLSPICWKYSNKFLLALLGGYLSGDGHWEEKNKRWRIGFTRNYNLERDLRTLSARLGFNLTLNLSNSFIGKKKYPSFRGEIKFEATFEGHWNQKNKAEVVAIRKARCREVYDIGIEGDSHLFALASGVLTHNSKPNPMPESVTDRCTKSHEYIFLLAKSAKYYFDAEAIKENSVDLESYKGRRFRGPKAIVVAQARPGSPNTLDMGNEADGRTYPKRNKRSVWTVTTKPFKDAHFATFPPGLIEPMILAGTSEKGCCPECGKAWVRVVEKINSTPRRVNSPHAAPPGQNPHGSYTHERYDEPAQITTLSWRPQCSCGKEPVPCIVLDCFMGAGTTAVVAKKLGRNYIGIELSEQYCKMGEERIERECGNLF